MTLHKESIKVQTSPSANHVRAYVVVVNWEPSGAQLPTPNREDEPQLSCSDPHTGWKIPHQLHANLGDLGDDELWQFMEDLCQEVALRELNASPRDPLPTPGGDPVGNGDPNVDDWEVTFLRGGGWEPTGQLLQPLAPIQPDGGWGPRGQPPQPPAPTQPDEDIGCLINTLAMGLQLGTPHINTFSGEPMPGKMEVSFEQWYHEVVCVKDHYLESVVWESIV